jgi:hypothetical protein
MASRTGVWGENLFAGDPKCASCRKKLAPGRSVIQFQYTIEIIGGKQQAVAANVHKTCMIEAIEDAPSDNAEVEKKFERLVESVKKTGEVFS